MWAGVGAAFVIGVPELADAASAFWAIDFQGGGVAKRGAAFGAERVWAFAVGKERRKLRFAAVTVLQVGMDEFLRG